MQIPKALLSCFLIFLILCFWMEKKAHRFHPKKLQTEIAFEPQWEIEEKEEVASILAQNFTFFNFGSQCYVFLSEDGNYVLKLFRYNRPRFPLVQNIKQLIHKKDRLLDKLKKTFRAYVLGCTVAAECTELIYVQLNLKPSAKWPPLKLTDRLGRRWTLPSHRVRFALQKRALPFEKTLKSALEKGEAQELLDSFVSLLEKRASLGIQNSDHNLFPNFGFLGKKAVEIDCGNYRDAPNLKNEKMRQQEIDRFLSQLKVWLEREGAASL